MTKFLSAVLLIWRNCVIAAVMLLTKEEKTIIAKRRTTTTNIRSVRLQGEISIEAGVNCVRDQWSAVKYLYPSEASSRRARRAQEQTPACSAPSASGPLMPMAHQVHAMKWFIQRMARQSLMTVRMMWKNSEVMLTLMSSSTLRSFTSRRSRMVRIMRSIRRVFPARPRATPCDSKPMNTSDHAEQTTVMSTRNQVHM